MVIVFFQAKCFQKSGNPQLFIDPSHDWEMTKCSDIFNFIASLWHFDKETISYFAFLVIAVSSRDQAP